MSAAKGFRNAIAKKAKAVQQGEAPMLQEHCAFVSTCAAKPRFGKTVKILFKEVPMKKVADIRCERSLLKEEGDKMAAD